MKISLLQFAGAVALYICGLLIQDRIIKNVGKEIVREEKLNICTKQSKKYYTNLKLDREKYHSLKGFIFFVIIYAYPLPNFVIFTH